MLDQEWGVDGTSGKDENNKSKKVTTEDVDRDRGGAGFAAAAAAAAATGTGTGSATTPRYDDRIIYDHHDHDDEDDEDDDGRGGGEGWFEVLHPQTKLLACGDRVDGECVSVCQTKPAWFYPFLVTWPTARLLLLLTAYDRRHVRMDRDRARYRGPAWAGRMMINRQGGRGGGGGGKKKG